VNLTRQGGRQSGNTGNKKEAFDHTGYRPVFECWSVQQRQ